MIGCFVSYNFFCAVRVLIGQFALIGHKRVADWSILDAILYSPTIAFFSHVVAGGWGDSVCVSLFVFTTPTPFSGNRSVLLSVFIALGFILRISSHRTFDPVVAPLPRGLLARFRFCDWTHNIFIWLLFSFLSLFRTFFSPVRSSLQRQYWRAPEVTQRSPLFVSAMSFFLPICFADHATLPFPGWMIYAW